MLLVKSAQEQKLNVMLETSGRDIAMYDYVERFFPSDKYQKMVIHFKINDIAFAERSVDRRMQQEMKDGATALGKVITIPVCGVDGAVSSSSNDMPLEQQQQPDFAATVDANAGGPYGSSQLRDVQRASDAVWNTVIGAVDNPAGGTLCYPDWLKVSMDIAARDVDDGEWTCCVGGREFEISKR